VILVHGLRGHPRKTWEATVSIYWPEEYLIPDIPQARVWAYGYDADVFGFFQPNNQSTISQHGQDLRAKLERQIENKDPIVFVVYSLGGIIVKDVIA
ncbi:hypothetical protein CC80DRAFT_405685, partial [Byssothecium circinans]